jgi:regulator of protease activity HflC (stomatin/prohibitin superfamily)
MRRVDITENMVDVEPQKIITKDDLNATVDAVVYFRVVDPVKAKYAAQNYYMQITSLARTTLRDIIGKMTLTEANSKRDTLNAILEKELDKQTDAWGIDVIRVELQRIEPPPDVQQAMNNVVIAEREKKAAIDFATATETQADGERRAEIKKAEGQKQGLILQAEGEAEAIRKVALAEADKIEKVNTAIQKFFKNEAQVYKKLETVERSLRDGSKYVIDPNTSITNVIAERMAGIVPIEKKPVPRPTKSEKKE